MSCLRLIAVLSDIFKKQHAKTLFTCIVPQPTLFGYFKCYRNREKACTALSHSLDAFALLFARVSFYIAICDQGDTACITSSSSTSTHPEWFQRLSDSPEFSQLLADSSISDFTSKQQRAGVIVNVASCSFYSEDEDRCKFILFIYWHLRHRHTTFKATSTPSFFTSTLFILIFITRLRYYRHPSHGNHDVSRLFFQRKR